MPSVMTEALNAEIRKVIDAPDMRARFAQEGAEPALTMTAAHVRVDIEKWRTIAHDRDIMADRRPVEVSNVTISWVS